MFRFFRVMLAKLIQLVVFIFRLLIAPFVIASLNTKYFNFSSFFSYARSGISEHSKLKKILRLLSKDLVTKHLFEQLLKANASTLNHLERVLSILKSRDILQVLNKDSLSELIYVCIEQPSHLAGLYFICDECHSLLKSSDRTEDINRFIKILSLKKDITEYKKIFLEFKRYYFEDLEHLFDILINDFLLAKKVYDFIKWPTKIDQIEKPTIILKITDRVKLKHLLETCDSMRESKVFIYKRGDINRKFELMIGNIDRIQSISRIFQDPVICQIFDNPRIPSIYNRATRIEAVRRAFNYEESTALFDAVVSAGSNQHKIIIRLLELPSWLSSEFTDKQYLNVIVLLKNLQDEDAKLLSETYSDDTFQRKIKVLLKLKESTNFLSGDPAKITANIGFVLRSENLGRIDDIIKFTNFIKATFPQFLTDEVIKFAIDNPSEVLNLKTMLERRGGDRSYPESLATRISVSDTDYAKLLVLATRTSVSDTDHAKLLALDLLLVVEQQRKLLPRSLGDVIPTIGYVGDRANVVKARERFAKLKTLYDKVFLSPPYYGSIEIVEQHIRTTILNAIVEAAKSASFDSRSVCYDPNKEAIIRLLTPNNIRVLAEGTEPSLAAQARQLFVAESIPAQTAWRAYDFEAARRGNSSLFVINPKVTGRRIHDNGSDILIDDAISEIRTMGAYTYLSAIDTTTRELAAGSSERINKLINTIAEIMRGLNGDSYPIKGPDAPSCFPGAISRLGLACLSHPHFVKELEAAPLQIHAKVQAMAQRQLEAIISDELYGETWSIEDKQSLYYASMALGLENAREILKGTDRLDFLSLADIEPKKIFASRARFLAKLFSEWNFIMLGVLAYLTKKGITINREQMKFYIFRSLLDLKGLKLTLTDQQKIQIGLFSEEQVTAMDDTEDMLQDFFPMPQSLGLLRSQKKYAELASQNEREKYLVTEYYLPLYKHQDYQALLRQCQDLEITDSNKYCRDILETRYSNLRGVTSQAELQRKLQEPQRSGQKLIEDTKESNRFYPDWQLPEQIDTNLINKAFDSRVSIVTEPELPLRRVRMR